MAIVKSPHPSVPLTDQTITERLFADLETRPDDAVLIDGPTGRAMTARAFMEGVAALAGGLAARGQGPGTVTALMAPNCPRFALAFHGILYAGGTVTTVNPTYKAEELNHQLSDSGATLLITIPAFLETAREGAKGTGVTEIVTIGPEDGWTSEPTGEGAEGTTALGALMGAPLAAQVPVDVVRDTAVLPYSSGTTGLPKGVMLSHRNMVVNVDQFLASGDVQRGETTIAFLPFFHIYGLNVLMNAYLAGGATLVTLPRFDLELFLTLVARHRTRQAYIAPPVALALAKHPLVDQYDVSCLETLFSAAAPLGRDVAEAVGGRIGCLATQGWGMTEIAPLGTVSSPRAHRPGSVGQACSDTEVRIVDPETGEDVVTGAEGELWIRGPQVMLGYLHRPDATAETVTEDGWLRSGDLASVDADGFVYIHDRLKELIKVKGFQVAPAEIEAVLLTHDDVVDVAVVGRHDDEAGERPVAHVVLREGAAPDAEALKAHVAAHLSSYKELAEVHFTHAIPKSASGKILRRMLRAHA